MCASFLGRASSVTSNRLGGCLLALLCVSQQPVAREANAAEKPNLVIMLADDMGFGEVQCLNPERGKIPTPHLDAVAASGMTFTDAHGGSSVCTPTRYGLMTGRYAWRTRLQSGVLTGGESLIDADRLTLAKMLREQGYHTAIIGKWHLGMLFDGQHLRQDVPVGAKVTHGPLDRGGFDEFHGFHHSRQIRTWIDNDVVTESVEPIEVLPRLTRAAVEYIERRKDDGQPFCLYVPWSSPHSPVVPSQQWQGKSGLNAHADFVMQTDDSFGQVIEALHEAGMWEQTLVICSSDNGTSRPTSKMEQLQRMGHYPSGNLRGSKADIWDGGHRIPLLVSWPQVIEPGSRCDRLVCLTDVLATAAEILGVNLPPQAAVDSISLLSHLRAAAGQPSEVRGRQEIIHHSISGYFAIRQGPWKLSLCPGSGGWTPPRPRKKNWSRVERSGEPLVQLIDMETDIGEQHNLAAEHPEKVQALKVLLRQQVERGRSTPGPAGDNDVPVVIEKRPGR